MNKWNSRTLWAWIVSTLIFLFLIWFYRNEKEVVLKFIPWWGGITIVYIGIQKIRDFIEPMVTVIKAWKGKDE